MPTALSSAGIAPAEILPAGQAASRDAFRAVRGGLQLTASLLFTWTVAVIVRLCLPRLLGPSRYGQLNFAEAIAATFLLLSGLGIDAYIRKEIPIRPEHASEFIGGVVLARASLSALATGAMAALLVVRHEPAEVRTTALIFAAAQFVISLNETLAALLQARTSVGGLALANMAAKVVWGAGALVAVLGGARLAVIAEASLTAECIKALALGTLAYRHAQLRLLLNLGVTGAVVVACLPYYLTAIAQNAYTRLPVSLLALMGGDDAEVGWYGAASGVASLALLVTPALVWVLMPLLAKAAARSRDDLARAVRRAMEALLSIALPASLLLALGADTWTHFAFGPAFAPAAMSLRILAPLFVLTYVATISAITLMMLNRGWAVAVTSLIALCVAPTLCVILIGPGRAHWGPGGGGAACALALCATEGLTAMLLVRELGDLCFDQRSLRAMRRALLVSAAVICLDRSLAEFPALVRLALDGLSYLVLASAAGALRIGEMITVVREALSRHDPTDSPA